MKKLTVLITLIALVVSSGILKADTYVYPADGPSFSITLPNNWIVNAEDKDLSASPQDESIFLLLSVFEEADNLDGAIDHLDSELESILSDIEYDEPEMVEINGIDFLTIDGSGIYDDVEVLISVAIFMPDDENVFLLLYLGTEEAENEHGDELDEIVNSITGQ